MCFSRPSQLGCCRPPTQIARIGTPNHKALASLVWGWHRVRARPSWCRRRRFTAISTQRHHGPRSNTHRPAVATAGAMMGMGVRWGARGRFVVCTGEIHLSRPSLSPCFEAHRTGRAPLSGRQTAQFSQKTFVPVPLSKRHGKFAFPDLELPLGGTTETRREPGRI